MNGEKRKCVMVLEENLPPGLLANTAAILGFTLGKELPELVGESVADKSGKPHLGIIEFPIPILRGSASGLRRLRETLYAGEYEELTVVDFSDLAQSCRAYDEFIVRMGETPEEDLRYCGIAMCGPVKTVSRLTGRLPLFR